MKRGRRPTFFILAVAILTFTYFSLFGLSNYYGDNKITYIKGVNDIRWGIDIRGGVEAVFMPDLEDTDLEDITSAQIDQATSIINVRLVDNNITDAEVYPDKTRKQIVVRFPWQVGETDFDPAEAVKELGATAMLRVWEGTVNEQVVLQGSADIGSAQAVPDPENVGQYAVSLTLTSQGAAKFAEATERLVGQQISIWMDDVMLSAPTVNQRIPDGQAEITGNFTSEEATDLANQINAGSLPFNLSVDNSKLKIISPTMGEQALDVMAMAAVIAFVAVCVVMLALYRLPGFVACISLCGQMALMLACISGFFGNFSSFTLTIPGIAGIILSIGIGVDANVITAERIREEMRGGKTVDGALEAGFSRGFTAILDGNVTVIIVAIILMTAFGPPNSFLGKLLGWIMFMFKSSITGSIYSFGYTLLIGSIGTLIFGVGLSRVMLRSLSRFRRLRKPWLYGGVKDGE